MTPGCGCGGGRGPRAEAEGGAVTRKVVVLQGMLTTRFRGWALEGKQSMSEKRRQHASADIDHQAQQNGGLEQVCSHEGQQQEAVQKGTTPAKCKWPSLQVGASIHNSQQNRHTISKSKPSACNGCCCSKGGHPTQEGQAQNECCACHTPHCTANVAKVRPRWGLMS